MEINDRELIRDLAEISKHTRISENMLTKLGVSSLRLNKGKDGVVIAALFTDYGIIHPVYFPRIDSNVGIYCNANFVTSYVTDGKVYFKDGKIINGSANQRAVENFFEELKEDDSYRFSKCLSDELWQIENDDEEIDKDEKKVKSLNILGYTHYLDFPEMPDGTPYNVVWMADGTPMVDVCKTHPELKEIVRFSSLAQNGICAMAGPLNENREFQKVKQFNGTKGKLDISATQGPKNYKQVNKHNRVLIVLAEIQPKCWEHPLNIMGNAVATREAFDEYVSLLTKDMNAEKGCKYPGHKIFIRTADELVRVKGATNCYKMKATLEDGTVENKIVALPPREYSTKGKAEVDTDKFEYLCQVSKEDLHEVTLEYDGKTINTVGLYMEVYEDAAHSAVYSLKKKPQNIFYYGAIAAIFRNNGWLQMQRAFVQMLDQDKLANALNVLGLEKQTLIPCSLKDILG